MNKLIFKLNHTPQYEGFYGLLRNSSDKPELVRVWLDEDMQLVCGSIAGVEFVKDIKYVFWTDKIECSLEGNLV